MPRTLRKATTRPTPYSLIGRVTVVLLLAASLATLSSAEEPSSYIVQALSDRQAALQVEAQGGTVDQRLAIIDGVAASLTREQAAALTLVPGITLQRNAAVEVESTELIRRRFEITSGSDDAMETIDTGYANTRYDKHFVGGNYSSERLVGLRFRNLDVPPGAKIVRAMLEVELVSLSWNQTEVDVLAEATGHAEAFADEYFNLSSRPVTAHKVRWQLAGTATPGVRTQSADLSPVVQSIVDREDWQAGNALALLLHSRASGVRPIAAFEAWGSGQPVLHLEYQLADAAWPVVSSSVRRGNADALQRQDNGVVLMNTSDLDFSAADQDAEMASTQVGLHFEDLAIPAGTTILSASIQFEAAAAAAGTAWVEIHAEHNADATAFSSTWFDLTNRPRTRSNVVWRPASWQAPGQLQFTDDLGALVQEVVDLPGWQPGNGMSFFFEGLIGTRPVRSSEGGGEIQLLVEYAGDYVDIAVDNSHAGACQQPVGSSNLKIVAASLSGVDSATIEVAGGAPNAPLSLDGKVVGCLDDHGSWYGELYGHHFDTCEVTISDGLSSIGVTVSDCVAWRDTHFPLQTGARELHRQGLTGSGVGIAFIDTGIQGRLDWGSNVFKMAAHYDVLQNRALHFWTRDADRNGHGSHVASVAGSQGQTPNGDYNGMAPEADIIMVRAFDRHGRGSYANVIEGIEWVINNRHALNIRVLNLSFSAPATSHYWQDPLNQAVMEAWRAGIVVVSSAGNSGPDPMTIGVPGNNPYVITVGAMTDSYTPNDPSDDRIASFSAAGPTFEAFAKPELVAPGGHMLGLMNFDAQLALDHPTFHDGPTAVPYFVMSGTSQAAAVVSGAAALLLQSEPGLEPDDVKCRLVATAKTATLENGDLAFSIFRQGAGMLDIKAAVDSSAHDCANSGLDIDRDLADIEHYVGPVRYDSASEQFYLEGPDSFLWNVSGPESESMLWNVSMLWNNSFLWNVNDVSNESFLWNVTYSANEVDLGSSSMLWNNSFLWNVSMLWNNTYTGDALDSATAVNTWVPQE